MPPRQDPPGFPPSLEERGLAAPRGTVRLGDVADSDREALRQEAEHRVRQELRAWIAENDRRVEAEVARVRRAAHRTILLGFLAALLAGTAFSLALTKHLTREVREEARDQHGQAVREREALTALLQQKLDALSRSVDPRLAELDRRLSALAASNDNPRSIAAAQGERIARAEEQLRSILTEIKLVKGQLDHAAADRNTLSARIDMIEAARAAEAAAKARPAPATGGQIPLDRSAP